MATSDISFEVRPIDRSHAEDWLRMRAQLWPDETGAQAREIEQFFTGTARIPLHVLIAVDASGRGLGFAELFIRNYAEDCVTDRVAYLEGWYVEPAVRRRGVGRALIAAAERWAASVGCTEFGSDALIDNHVSVSAHLALGFTETTQIRTFRKTIEPL